MTARHDLDRRLNDFLRDGPTELPYQSFDAVRDRTDQTGQRVVLGPWRLPEMNKIVTIGLGAAAVVVAVFVGAQFFGSPNGSLGSDPSPTLDATATPEPTPTPEPSSSPLAAPPLSGTYTSTQHGITLSYPEGWTVEAATEPWTESDYSLLVDPATPYIDFLFDPTLGDHLFLNVSSQPIGDATPGEWTADKMAGTEGCTPTEPVTVDGAGGLIGTGGCDIVVVVADGRGYWIGLHASDDDPAAVAPYHRAWFEEVLATVQLHPEDALE
jgi:hypothetical protein